MSTNTAIYQSASVVVFIMSVPLLRERVTLTKTFSVILTVVGVCLISLYSLKEGNSKVVSNTSALLLEEDLETSDNSSVRNTPLGYVVSSMFIVCIL